MPKPKILLVDDVQLILELEKSFLKFLPVRVLTARNGREALEMVRRERPELVYMDLNMPVMDGPSCCAAIKGDPELAGTPVVMVTTAGRVEDETLCRQAGCNDFLTKPIDRRLFLEKGRRFIPTIDRREQRVFCSAPLSVSNGGEPVTGVSADLSIGGMYVASDLTVVTDSPVELSFEVPGSEGRQVSATARVAWENSSASRRKPSLPIGFGIEFTDMDSDAASFIKAFIDGTILKL